jgi:predicted N-acetyltransferase YhbS
MTEMNGILVITPEKRNRDKAFKFLLASLFQRVKRFYQRPKLALVLKERDSFGEFVACVRTSKMFEGETGEAVCLKPLALSCSLKPKILGNRVRNAYKTQRSASNDRAGEFGLHGF